MNTLFMLCPSEKGLAVDMSKLGPGDVVVSNKMGKVLPCQGTLALTYLCWDPEDWLTHSVLVAHPRAVGETGQCGHVQWASAFQDVGPMVL